MKAGYFKGKHYTQYVEEVKALKRAGALDNAAGLLVKLINAVEAEAAAKDCGVAPWYYEQLAIVYRKQGKTAQEIEILERFERQPHARGKLPPKLLDRLRKLRRS